MSNPNPVNLNNLDGRYAKPADVISAISAQAVTDAGQYALLPSSRSVATALMQNEAPVTPYQFGAKGDGKTLLTASLTSGSSTVTIAGANFSAADVGKLIVVLPAVGSSQTTFASTISAVNSPTSVNAANSAPYTGNGLECTWSTDDTAALQAWLDAGTSAGRYIPGAIFGFKSSLVLYNNSFYSIHCASSATLKVMAQIAAPTTWPVGSRSVPTAVYSPHNIVVQSQKWSGGHIDTSNLCQDGFSLKWARTYTVEGLKVRGGAANGCAFIFGDDSMASSATSYQINITGCLGWRDFGTVPRSALVLSPGTSLGTGTITASSSTITINNHGLANGQMVSLTSLSGGGGITSGANYYVSSATTNTFKLITFSNSSVTITSDGSATVTSYGMAASIGLKFTASASDSLVSGKTTMMGYQVGFENRSGNNHFGPATHAWSRPSVGLMDYGFDDHCGTTHYTGTYSDTPVLAGYRARNISSPCHYIHASVYNGLNGGIDNIIFGFIIDGVSAGHTFVAPRIYGENSSYRILHATASPSGSFLVMSHPWVAASQTNVTNTQAETITPRPWRSYTTSTSLFSGDAGCVIELDSSSAMNYTIPANLLSTGQYVDLVQKGTGQVTIVAGSGATVRSYNNLMNIKGQYGQVRITRSNNYGIFYASGDLA